MCAYNLPPRARQELLPLNRTASPHPGTCRFEGKDIATRRGKLPLAGIDMSSFGIECTSHQASWACVRREDELDVLCLLSKTDPPPLPYYGHCSNLDGKDECQSMNARVGKVGRPVSDRRNQGASELEEVHR